MRNYNLFVDTHSVSDCTYFAGRVAKDDRFFVAYEQKGANDTFSIGMPVYDKDNHLMGYLGIGFYHNLNYSIRFNGESIPVERWEICNPTKYCEVGKSIYTYPQRWHIDPNSDTEIYITCIETAYSNSEYPDFIKGKKYHVISTDFDGYVIEGENCSVYMSNTQIDSFFRGE